MALGEGALREVGWVFIFISPLPPEGKIERTTLALVVDFGRVKKLIVTSSSRPFRKGL